MGVLKRPDWLRDFTMKRIRATPVQMIRKVKKTGQLIVQGNTDSDVCLVIEVSQATYHRWRQQCGGMQAKQ